MNFVTKFLSVLGLTVVLIAPASAAILVMDGGTIKGATGVNIGGTSYDVTFGERLCKNAKLIVLMTS
jgi:hypothetical protein